jgi:hypothetical protein
VSNQQLKITRIAQPECFQKQNIVKVNYQTFVEELKSNYISEIKEKHEMRAFEAEEIEGICRSNRVRSTTLRRMANQPFPKPTYLGRMLNP